MSFASAAAVVPAAQRPQARTTSASPRMKVKSSKGKGKGSGSSKGERKHGSGRARHTGDEAAAVLPPTWCTTAAQGASRKGGKEERGKTKGNGKARSLTVVAGVIANHCRIQETEEAQTTIRYRLLAS